jgi:hypothetical protein
MTFDRESRVASFQPRLWVTETQTVPLKGGN